MRSNVRRAEELGDDDIIEVLDPAHRSGTYSAVRPPPPPLPPPRGEHGLPRLGSIPDGATTGVSDLVSMLARISDPGSLPRLKRPYVEVQREPAEALLITFIQDNMTVQAIVGMSPLGEESTLRILAKLVIEGTIILVD
jgi:hypothetical protein